ncbi:CU044_2847 family protein [Nonomuraea gerenzanensis]|uniref:Trypsin-co-occurring domain-containing protein n=1 Tax=Nonomuraea gerenzanensis TaxID=93944 RepID=A0A1M4EAG7_9ACTN|nr:CU044_2847 family protein [Nonomuraea gerenzanensis]UBU17992.1 hypothetical protein LCN96_24105 [Nonomuraea gerenzanensis]SBO95796.1 hypothetical protein BN4615_P5312 [Nonomuraea gerenzanensis]
MPIIRSDDASIGEPGELRPIYVEVDRVVEADEKLIWSERETRADPASKVVTLARDVFGEGVELARSCAVRVARGLADLSGDVRPDEFELQVAIKLDSEVGAVLAKASAGAQLQVTMRWRAK